MGGLRSWVWVVGPGSGAVASPKFLKRDATTWKSGYAEAAEGREALRTAGLETGATKEMRAGVYARWSLIEELFEWLHNSLLNHL